jgi:hypothetical protein
MTNNSKHVYAYNMTRETFLATKARVADGYFSRLIGLLGKTGRWARAGRGLWIVPSHGVHTIGMLFAIDLIFLDRERRVVHIEECVRPFRISKVSLKTTSVLELPPHTIFRTGTQVGDELEISRLGGANFHSIAGHKRPSPGQSTPLPNAEERRSLPPVITLVRRKLNDHLGPRRRSRIWQAWQWSPECPSGAQGT